MKILVTGAGGQLGTEVANVFQKLNKHEVVSCNRDALNVASEKNVFEVLAANKPNVVIHCAAFTAVDVAETEIENAREINAVGTRNIVKASESVGARVIYLSTDYVFDGTKTGPYNEADATNPINVYGQTKLEGEQQCRASDAIVRTSWVFGVHGHNIVKTLLHLGSQRNTNSAPLQFVDDQRGKPTCTRDLAFALHDLVELNTGGVFHLTNDCVTTWFDFARDVFNLAKFDSESIQPVKTADMNPVRPAKRPLNSELGNFAWQQSAQRPLRDHREALAEVVEELRNK